MNFKEQMLKDQDVFINNNEFAETHMINNKELNIVVDNDRLMHRSKKEFDGISVGEILYYVKTIDYGNKPKIDEIQTFDGHICSVFDVRENNGIYEIILKRNES